MPLLLSRSHYEVRLGVLEDLFPARLISSVMLHKRQIRNQLTFKKSSSRPELPLFQSSKNITNSYFKQGGIQIT